MSTGTKHQKRVDRETKAIATKFDDWRPSLYEYSTHIGHRGRDLGVPIELFMASSEFFSSEVEGDEAA